jgi:hypothetical protein
MEEFTRMEGRHWQHNPYKPGGLVLHWEGVFWDRLLAVWWWSWLWWDLQCWFLWSNQSIPPVFCLYFYQFARFPTMRANNPFTPDHCQLPQKTNSQFMTHKEERHLRVDLPSASFSLISWVFWTTHYCRAWINSEVVPSITSLRTSDVMQCFFPISCSKNFQEFHTSLQLAMRDII